MNNFNSLHFAFSVFTFILVIGVFMSLNKKCSVHEGFAHYKRNKQYANYSDNNYKNYCIHMLGKGSCIKQHVQTACPDVCLLHHRYLHCDNKYPNDDRCKQYAANNQL